MGRQIVRGLLLIGMFAGIGVAMFPPDLWADPSVRWTTGRYMGYGAAAACWMALWIVDGANVSPFYIAMMTCFMLALWITHDRDDLRHVVLVAFMLMSGLWKSKQQRAA
jgi:hypothetical protein